MFMMHSRNSNLRYISIALFTILTVVGTTVLYKKIYYENNIQDYKPSRDREFILNLFKNNWYWLTANDSLKPEKILDSLSLFYPDGSHKADITIKVNLENNQPTGFIAYYKKKLYQGYVQFMAVDEKYRGKGYAQKLLSYAIEDLKNRDCIKVRMLTRMSNLPARAVYTKLGFKKRWSNEEFIEYEKNLD